MGVTMRTNPSDYGVSWAEIEFDLVEDGQYGLHFDPAAPFPKVATDVRAWMTDGAEVFADVDGVTVEEFCAFVASLDDAWIADMHAAACARWDALRGKHRCAS